MGKSKSRFSAIVSVCVFVVCLSGWCMFSGVLAVLTKYAVSKVDTETRLAVRDFVIAEIAFINAGNPVPFKADYVESGNICSGEPENTSCSWGMRTNSKWLIDRENVVIPFLAYEHITDVARDPGILMWVPYTNDMSFHVAGQTSMNYLDVAVTLNSRYLFDKQWNDERNALGTLTHELIHTQGWWFMFPHTITVSTPDYIVELLRSDLEARTSSATIEALAGMCRYGDRVSCQSFWLDIHHMSKGALRYRADVSGNDSVYQFIANTLWRDDDDRMAAQKQGEYYSDNNDELINNLLNYSYKPWNEHVVYNVCGYPVTTMGTGNPFSPNMPFNDTVVMLGWVRWVMCQS